MLKQRIQKLSEKISAWPNNKSPSATVYLPCREGEDGLLIDRPGESISYGVKMVLYRRNAND